MTENEEDAENSLEVIVAILVQGLTERIAKKMRRFDQYTMLLHEDGPNAAM